MDDILARLDFDRDGDADANEPVHGSELKHGKKYQILDVIDKGGMGTILKARDSDLCRNVAMKIMLRDENTKGEEFIRFVEEARVSGQLEHPNIVPVHELGIDGSGNIFFTMKHVKGENLGSILKRLRHGDPHTVKEFSLNRLLQIFLKICDGVAFAHSRNVVHRDLKPENVMIGQYGEVVVLDWGLVKVLPAKEGQAKDELVETHRLDTQIESVRLDASQTHAGRVLGTPNYMSPEQALGDTENVDQRSDIYALGGILYNILTLRRPIEGKNAAIIITDVVAGNIDHPCTFTHGARDREGKLVILPHCPNHAIPEPLAMVTRKAMSVDRDRRYQNVKNLQGEIEAWLGGFPTRAEHASLFRQVDLLFQRHSLLTVSALAVFAGLLAVSLTMCFLWQGADSSQRRARTAYRSATAAWRKAVALREVAEEAQTDEARARVAAEYDAYTATVGLAAEQIANGEYALPQEILPTCPPRFRGWEWFYLKSVSDQAVQVYDFPFAADRRVLFDLSPDGRRMAVSVESRPGVRLYNTLDRRLIGEWPKSPIAHDVRFSPDGNKLAIASAKKLFVYDADTEEAPLVFDCEAECFAFTPNSQTIYSAVVASRLWQLDLNSGKAILHDLPRTAHSLVARDLEVVGKGNSVCILTDGQLLIVRTADHSLQRIFTDPKIYTSSFAVSPAGDDILSVGVDSVYRISLASGEVLQRVRVKGQEPSCCAFSVDSRVFAVGYSDAALRIYSASDAKLMRVFHGHRTRTERIRFGPHARFVFSAGHAHIVRKWDTNESHSRMLLHQYRSPQVTYSAFSPCGRYLFIGADGAGVACLDSKTGKHLYQRTNDVARGFSFSADGNLACFQSGLIEAATGEEVAVDLPKGDEICAIAPDGHRFIVCRTHKTGSDFFIWDRTADKKLRKISCPVGSSEARFCINLQGTHLVAYGGGYSTNFIDLHSGRVLWRFPRASHSAAFSRDGTLLAIGTHAGVRLIRTNELGKAKCLYGHRGTVRALCFSPDGARLFSGADGRSVKVWDTSTGRLLISLRGFKGRVTSIAVSNDEAYRVVTSTDQGKTVVWEAGAWSTSRAKAARGESSSVDADEL